VAVGSGITRIAGIVWRVEGSPDHRYDAGPDRLGQLGPALGDQTQVGIARANEFVR
jgi:hypothetical protein